MNLKNLDYQMEEVQSMIDAKTTFLLELNPVYTLQKALFADPKTAALYADKFNLDLSTLSNDVILEEYANEKYLEVEAEVIDLKSSLINMKENYKFSEKLLTELKAKRESFILSLKNNDYNLALNDEFDVLNGFINQISKAAMPVSKISPKISLNIGLGFILGLLVSIFAALFKNYLISNDIKK
jgi:LPS O-antigen subunit length determinant protein (WzzB/FepE family)